MDNSIRIRFIKRSIDEMDYLMSIMKLKKVGYVYQALCPFHHEKTPSLTIYPPGFKNNDGIEQKNMSFYCFGCHATGDIITFIQKYENINSITETCDYIEQKFNLQFNDDEEIEELSLMLQDVEQTKPNIMSLLDINFTCSIMCRDYLFDIKNNNPDVFDYEFNFIQRIYKRLDEELLEKNALQAKYLIDMIANIINKRKEKYLKK